MVSVRAGAERVALPLVERLGAGAREAGREHELAAAAHGIDVTVYDLA